MIVSDQKTVKRPPWRPGLEQHQKNRIIGELGILTPGTSTYRLKRRELAVDFDRTERAIDTVMQQLRSAVVQHATHKERGAPDANAPEPRSSIGTDDALVQQGEVTTIGDPTTIAA